ncbi:MAG: hypothetical protein HY754_09040 [Nitrospirae bacterium]|nr:hypothetical protein [Nitrospirota bacterium]
MSGKLKLFLLIAVIGVAVVILGKVYLNATSPSSVKVMVYKVELMTAALDTNPQVIFSNAAGQEIDLAKNTDTVVWQAQIPAGTYKRIRMTVANGVKQSIANAGENPCGGDVFTDRVFSLVEGTDPNSQVEINFATHDDSGGTWSGSKMTHFLLGPVTIRESRMTRLRFNFVTANTLFCSGGAVEIRSPWAVWAEIL